MRDDDDKRQLKIELLSQWKLEAEFRKKGAEIHSFTKKVIFVFLGLQYDSMKPNHTKQAHKLRNLSS